MSLTDIDRAPAKPNFTTNWNHRFSPNIGSPTHQQAMEWRIKRAGPAKLEKPGPIAQAVIDAIHRRQKDCLVSWESVPRDESNPYGGSHYRLLTTEADE